MTKLIQLTLSKIKYSGDSIGDDIRIEVDCLNHSVDVNKKVPNGSDVSFNIPVGAFFTDQASFSLPLSVRLIERDLIYNDVGTTEKTFVADTRIVALQYFSAKIEIQETRKYKTKKKAVFEITFGVKVTDAVAYVKYDGSGDGWLKVRPEGGGGDVSIPYYIKVRVEKQKNNRQYITILEGLRRGQKVSVTLDKDGSSFLQTENPHTAPVHFTYSLSTRVLKLKTKRYLTLDYKDDERPWERRLYTIAIPDSPHKGGQAYLDRATLALVWFKTSHPDDKRYVHPGAYTAGCITLTEIKRWDELCRVLLKARKGDGKNIGTVEVTD